VNQEHWVPVPPKAAGIGAKAHRRASLHEGRVWRALPGTILGKVLAAIFAVAAVGVVALPTSILAASFSDAFERERCKGRTSGE
jgi:hypothetical protein